MDNCLKKVGNLWYKAIVSSRICQRLSVWCSKYVWNDSQAPIYMDIQCTYNFAVHYLKSTILHRSPSPSVSFK